MDDEAMLPESLVSTREETTRTAVTMVLLLRRIVMPHFR